MRLLVVEDDAALCASLEQALERAGYAVDTADNGEDAEHLGNSESYDAVVLDLGLPRRPGLEVLKHWRTRGRTMPVIILTARDTWQEKVDGFKAGADDYLAKPFHVEELIARVGAIIRRRHGEPKGGIRTADLALDEERQTVTYNGKTVELTGTEFRLLRYFMLHPGKILSKTELTEHVYDFDSERDSNVIEVYIRRLREKLDPGVIQTRRGQGYVFGAKS
ncbi:transcriptional regulator [Sulfuricaulis limicola]|uniref:Transcriptional regulator n=1 Tax=Sulfuricaulis limicola TaxID=1620215 RepID=A0A1B4XCR1_9GAMM|nr:response regulator transcription factor [Sulfuricaulis limicola]BAV32560.1 transcriptional regulator [Sulfuricaulis limicola]